MYSFPILNSGDTKDAKRAESWIIDKDFRNQLSGYEKKMAWFANLLVIQVQFTYVDILKAKIAVWNLGEVKQLKAEWPEGTLQLKQPNLG